MQKIQMGLQKFECMLFNFRHYHEEKWLWLIVPKFEKKRDNLMYLNSCNRVQSLGKWRHFMHDMPMCGIGTYKSWQYLEKEMVKILQTLWDDIVYFKKLSPLKTYPQSMVNTAINTGAGVLVDLPHHEPEPERCYAKSYKQRET